MVLVVVVVAAAAAEEVRGRGGDVCFAIATVISPRVLCADDSSGVLLSFGESPNGVVDNWVRSMVPEYWRADFIICWG